MAKSIKKQIEMLIIGLIYKCNEIKAEIVMNEELEIISFLSSIQQIKINNPDKNIYLILEQLRSSDRLKKASLGRHFFVNNLISIIYHYLEESENLTAEELLQKIES